MSTGTWLTADGRTPVPLHNHLPALALTLALLGVLALGWPWPEPVADGFDAQGRAVHWAWPPATIVPAVFLLVASLAIDGLWEALERGRKRFNPLSLLDEAVIAWMLVRLADAGVARGVSPEVRAWAWAAGGIAVAAAAALELRRPGTRPTPPARAPEDVSAFSSDLAAVRAGDQRWSYWSVQKPPHQLLFGTLGACFMIGGIAISDSPLVMRLVLLAGGVLVLAFCRGGFRTVVTPRQLVLRAGSFGPPLLRLATSEIADVAVCDFDPLRDFGGWGIRRGLSGDLAGVWAFNLASRGVLVRTATGRRYLIGTEDPERLAAALNAARGAAVGALPGR